MSAAEKLRALGVYHDEGWDSHPVDEWEQRVFRKLHEALPQIVAVVQAATWVSESGVYSYERHAELTEALAQLSEALA